MFRAMRRSKQELSKAETEAVLARGIHGVLACLGDEDYPYAVPLNYVYWNGRIYFHSAREGQKMDAVIRNPKVSFTVIDQDTIVSAEYTSYFRSVIAFGRARQVEGAEKAQAFAALVAKYSGGQPPEEQRAEIAGCSRACILAIDIEHLTGKQAKELIQKDHPA